MSEEVRKYHEEDVIGKTYDFRVARRLLGYLRPYWRLAALALALTFLTNILISDPAVLYEDSGGRFYHA